MGLNSGYSHFSGDVVKNPHSIYSLRMTISLHSFEKYCNLLYFTMGYGRYI